jgi:hypothetical protein
MSSLRLLRSSETEGIKGLWIIALYPRMRANGS